MLSTVGVMPIDLFINWDVFYLRVDFLETLKEFFSHFVLVKKTSAVFSNQNSVFLS